MRARVAVAIAAWCGASIVACDLFGGDSGGGGDTAGFDMSPDADPPIAETPDDACPNYEAGGPSVYSVFPSRGGVGAWVSLGIMLEDPGAHRVEVFFGDAPAPVLRTAKETVYVRVPDGAVSGAIAVVVDCVPLDPSNFDFFVVDDVPAPIVSSFSPATASLDAGTVVTITGQYFTGATQVYVGDWPQPPSTRIVVQDDSTILFVPSGDPRTGALGVTTSSGSNDSDASFTVTP